MQNKPSKAARELHKATKRARKARKQIELGFFSVCVFSLWSFGDIIICFYSDRY